MTEKLDVKLSWNPIFKEANLTNKRYRIFIGSAASGKSMNIAQDYIKKLSAKVYHGANLLVVRRSESSHKNSTFSELAAAAHRMFGKNTSDVWKINPSIPEMECKLTGAKIIFQGMNAMAQRERIKSITSSVGKIVWIWCEEATEFSHHDIEILDDRLRGNLLNINPALFYQITLSFNPVSSSHWIKARFFDQQDEDVFICKSTYLDNRFIDPDFHKRMLKRRDIDPEGYKVYALGEWGEVSGLILSNWSVDSFPPDPQFFDDVAIGQDFGFNHPNAILALGIKDGNIYIRHELYLREMDTSEIIRAAEGNFNKLDVMYCDSAEPDRILSWLKAGYRAIGVKKRPGCVRASIDWLKARRIFISPECPSTIREISSWKWKKDEKSGLYIDEPVAFMDDAMAALRYGTSGWMTAVPKKKNSRQKGGELDEVFRYGFAGGIPGDGYLY